MSAKITLLYPDNGVDASRINGISVSPVDPVDGQSLAYQLTTKQYVPTTPLTSVGWSSVTDKPTTFAPIIGTTSTTACAGDDARLSNARTPSSTLAHKSSHATGGSDALALTDLGASANGQSLVSAANYASMNGLLGLGTTSTAVFGGLKVGTTTKRIDIYNLDTDASNYERGFLRWSSNVLEIGAEAAGTGTARNLRLYGKVGVGASPTYQFDIQSATETNLFSVKNTGGSATFFSLLANNGGFTFSGTTGGTTAAGQGASNFFGNFNNNAGILLKKQSTGVGDYLAIEDNSAAAILYVKSDGKSGFGTNAPTALLDINSDTIRLRTAKTPASASATGNTGDICWDASYVYVCTAASTWKRAAISTW